MSEAKNKDDQKDEAKKDDKGGKKTLSLGGTLSLKGGAAGGPRPSNPGTVSVEVRRKRQAPAQSAPASKAPEKDDGLSSAEREARAQALKKALAEGEKSKSSLPERKRVTIEDKKKQDAENKKAEEKSAREKELAELEKIEAEEKQRKDDINQNAPALPDPETAAANAARRGKFSDGPEESYRDRMKKAEEKAPPKPKPIPIRAAGALLLRKLSTVITNVTAGHHWQRSAAPVKKRAWRPKARKSLHKKCIAK